MAYIGLDGKRYTDQSAALAAGQGVQDARRDSGYTYGNNSLIGSGVNTMTPSQNYFQQYQQQQDDLRKRYSSEVGLDKYGQARNAARDAYSGFQQRDLMQVFKEMSDSLGLADISSQIASLQGTANKQKRVLEDLPDTIREGAEDVGISQGQLDLRSSIESRPLIRNIADLLNSVSVLSDQHQRGLQQAQFSTQLAGQQDQSRLSQLGAAYGMAQDDFNSAEGMFNNLFSAGLQGLVTPGQRMDMDFRAKSAAEDAAFREKSLLQDESQFARNLAFQQAEAARPRGGGGGGGAAPGSFYEEAAVISEKLNANQISWGNAWNYLKAKYPNMTNQQIDEALGKAAPELAGGANAKLSAGPSSPTRFSSFLQSGSRLDPARYAGQALASGASSLWNWLSQRG